MNITAISDLHGHYPELEGGDLLIIAGDLTAKDDYEELDYFVRWIAVQDYKNKVVVAGNRDTCIERNPNWINPLQCAYLCDSGIEVEGLKIWGSPWTKTFEGMNPHCKAFTCDTEEKLAEKWALIPDDTDILVTHSPPYGIRDHDRGYPKGCLGSTSLQRELFLRLTPKLMVCGHIHEGYGIEPPGGIVQRCVNASHVNEHYKPVNKPIRVEL